MRARAVRACDDDPAERLPELQPRCRARLPAELHDLPYRRHLRVQRFVDLAWLRPTLEENRLLLRHEVPPELLDRKSTRLNSSHRTISYAVFCLKKKTKLDGGVLLLDKVKRIDHEYSLLVVV